MISTKLTDTSKNAFDSAIEHVTETEEEVTDQTYKAAYHVSSWLESAGANAQELGEEVAAFSEDDQEHHGGRGGKGRKGHHGHGKKPNATVYELISKSKYTTKLAALINEYEDVVELLNGTAANYSTSPSVIEIPHSSGTNADRRPCSCLCSNRQSVRENSGKGSQAIEGATQEDITLSRLRGFLPSRQSLGHTHRPYLTLNRYTWRRPTTFGYRNQSERSDGQLLQSYCGH